MSKFLGIFNIQFVKSLDVIRGKGYGDEEKILFSFL